MYQQQKRRANVTVFDAQTDRHNEMTRDIVGCYVLRSHRKRKNIQLLQLFHTVITKVIKRELWSCCCRDWSTMNKLPTKPSSILFDIMFSLMRESEFRDTLAWIMYIIWKEETGQQFHLWFGGVKSFDRVSDEDKSQKNKVTASMVGGEAARAGSIATCLMLPTPKVN